MASSHLYVHADTDTLYRYPTCPHSTSFLLSPFSRILLPMHPLLEQLSDKVFSVSEYLTIVNDLLSPLRVEVEGEVTDLKVLPQWTFFSLKDAEDNSLLRCGLHSGQYRRLGVNLEEGMQVKVLGYGKLAAKSGNFGFWVSKIEPVGEGALRRAYELLVKKLSEEGLFARKRELPQFIEHIGVISSKNGVVIQDLRNNLDPLGIRIEFIHSGVEGADSAGELLAAIEHFSRVKEPPQVLVLIRGGGSLESLQGFNNEAVCRALFAAPMPVVVGIGHDVDAPIATMVADWSASTPTAVAHVINDSWAPLTEDLPALTARMLGSFRLRVRTVGERMPMFASTISRSFRTHLRALEHRTELALRSAESAIHRLVQRFRAYESALRYAWRRIPSRIERLRKDTARHMGVLTEHQTRRVRAMSEVLQAQERLLHANSPEKALARGYSVVYGVDGRVVRDVDSVEVGQTLKTRLNKGTITSTVTEKEY